MKTLIRSTIGNSAALADSLPVAQIFERGSLTETPTVKPFAILASGGRVPGMAQVGVETLEIWVHDDRGTYDNINEIIENLIDLLDGRTDLVDEFYRAISVEYQSVSPDLEDDIFRTNTRSVAFRVVGHSM